MICSTPPQILRTCHTVNDQPAGTTPATPTRTPHPHKHPCAKDGSSVGRFTGFGLPEELLSRTVMIWAIHGSPAVVRVLQHCPGIWAYVESTELNRDGFTHSAISPVDLPL